VQMRRVVDGDGVELLDVKTPPLGEQTRFLLYGVRHADLIR